MLTKVTVVVLRVVRYNEKSDIVDTLSAGGRLSFLVPASRSHKAKVRRNLFQPLAILDIDADIRPKASLQRIKEARVLLPLADIPYNPVKSAMAFFMAEFLGRTIRDNEDNGPLFSYIINSIEWLDRKRDGYANFHLVFLMRMSRFLGLEPSMDEYRPGSLFDMGASCFISGMSSAASPHILSADDAGALHSLMRMTYDNMHVFRMNRLQRNRCTDLIMLYYTLHITDLMDMKSLPVLKKLFA